ncbi:hypothetical protein ACIREE_16765 [Streptomyces sp. NPDC102467]|uniref:hypothetical protein n=1 Tax=Streptomyces sp. NPDC102467 TaxID=3366179 RepID=UPI0038006AAD
MSQKFAQLVDFETRRFDELKSLLDRFEEQMAGEPGGPTHRILLQDREQPGRYLAILEFTSYDDAMRNNERPEVARLNEQLTELCTRPPAFVNCDVKDVRELK